MWSNGLATANMNTDYSEYAKQLELFLNAFKHQSSKQAEDDKSKSKI